MSNCAGIFQGGNLDCDNPLLVASPKRILVGNFGDFSVTFNATATNGEKVIESITNDSAKQFYEFEGINESISPSYELVRNSVSNDFRHIVDFSIFDITSAAKANLKRMAYRRTVAIVIQPDDLSYGDGAITMYGFSVGLDLLTAARTLNDVETGGAHVVQLATPEAGSNEKDMPISIFDGTSYASTLTLVEALLTPGV